MGLAREGQGREEVLGKEGKGKKRQEGTRGDSKSASQVDRYQESRKGSRKQPFQADFLPFLGNSRIMCV